MNVALVILRACHEEQRQQHRHQQQGEGQCEEELHGDEERWQNVIMYNVIFLLEDPHATREAHIVEPMNVLEVAQAHLPKP